MTDKERQAEETIRACLRQEALNRGPCPPVERLVQYLDRELSEEMEVETRAHLLACGRCEMLVLRMERFGGEETVAPIPRRLTLGFWAQPWFAYSVSAVLLTLFVARVGQNHIQGPATGPAAVGEAPPIFELSQTRGNEGTAIRPGHDEHFVLRFFVPMSANRSYVAEIQNSLKQKVLRPVELSQGGTGGNVDLLCRTNAFPPGSYILTVLEGGSIRLEYSFQIQ